MLRCADKIFPSLILNEARSHSFALVVETRYAIKMGGLCIAAPVGKNGVWNFEVPNIVFFVYRGPPEKRRFPVAPTSRIRLRTGPVRCQ